MGRQRTGQFHHSSMNLRLLAGRRGRGFTSPASSAWVRGAVLVRTSALALVLTLACGSPPAEDSRRELVLRQSPLRAATDCTVLPDTLVEAEIATIDFADFPDARVRLDKACPSATIMFRAVARAAHTYRVHVPKGRTLVARARGESAGVTFAFDFPPSTDSNTVARTVTDSIVAEAAREVAVRVMLAPQLRDEARASRVLLSLIVR